MRGDSLRGPAGLGAPDKLRHLLAALSDLQPAAVEYGRKAKRQEDGGMVRAGGKERGGRVGGVERRG